MLARLRAMGEDEFAALPYGSEGLWQKVMSGVHSGLENQSFPTPAGLSEVNYCLDSGLLAHFRTIADNVDKPIILYNVPSRTGCNLLPATCAALADHPRIAAVKEASGNISQVAKIAQLCGDELNIYSGNDDQVVPLLSLGGKGVISVVSNVKPELVHNCCKAWFEGDTKTACKLQLEILPLADALFCEVNPIPVKYAMNVLGWEAGPCRLPLVEPSDAHKEKIEQALEAEGLIRE